MSVINVVELINKRHASQGKKLERKYSRTFLVTCDSPSDSQLTALYHVSIPQLYHPYIVIVNGQVVEHDSYAICQDRRAERVNDSGCYEVTCEYSTEPIFERATQNSEGKPQQHETDLRPDQRPFTVGTSTKTIQEIIYEDYTPSDDTPAGPLPIKNSANMPFADPFMRDRPLSGIHLECDRTIWFFSKKTFFEGSVNKKDYVIQGQTFPARTLLLESYNGKSTKDGKYGYFWHLDASFCYKAEGWTRKIRDQGYCELVMADGVWLKKKILDDTGQPLLADLDGTGKRLPENGALRAVYIRREPFPIVDWGTGGGLF